MLLKRTEKPKFISLHSEMSQTIIFSESFFDENLFLEFFNSKSDRLWKKLHLKTCTFFWFKNWHKLIENLTVLKKNMILIQNQTLCEFFFSKSNMLWNFWFRILFSTCLPRSNWSVISVAKVRNVLFCGAELKDTVCFRTGQHKYQTKLQHMTIPRPF